MELSKQEYWSGMPFPPPRDLPNPGIEAESLASHALAGEFFTAKATWDPGYPLKWACYSHFTCVRLAKEQYVAIL